MTNKVTNFGTSAYLRILLQNPKPMETAVKTRVIKTNKSGRDYHAVLRNSIKKFIKNPSEIKNILAEIDKVQPLGKRNSVRDGFKATVKFLNSNGGQKYIPDEKLFESASGFFGVKFQPNLGLEIDGTRTAVHLWNNKSPDLTGRAVTAVLGLFLHTYKTNERPAIFCLQTSRLYLPQITRDEQRLAIAFSERIDALVQKYISLDEDTTTKRDLG